MGSYQWKYQPNPEELRSANSLPRLIELGVHSAGLFYFFIYIFSDSYFSIINIVFPITYILVVALWYLRLKKYFILGFTKYTIDEKGIHILNIDTKIKKTYVWDKLDFFSRSAKLHETPNIVISYSDNIDQYVYVSTGKNSDGV